MSYIGAEPTTAAFPFDQFSGNGFTTAFTLTYAPASATSIIVAISGVMQNPNLYSVVGTTLTFSPAPPTGTNNISVLYLGLPVIGSSSPGNTAFLSSTDLTATAGQTVFASAGSYTPGFVQVFRNGARLGNADFTATNGTTITLANAATSGDLVTIEYYTLTSLTNALPLTGGTVTGSTTFNTGVNLAVVSGSVGVGTTSPNIGSANTDNAILTLKGRASTRGGIFEMGNFGTTGNDQTLGWNRYFDGSTENANIEVARASSTSTAYMKFSTNGGSGVTERMRIDSSGNLLVGKTSTTGTASIHVAATPAVKNGINIAATTTGTTYAMLFYTSDGVDHGYISYTTSGTSYNTTSDYRLKEAILPMTGALAKVAQLKPVTYKWKADNADGQGFIAHELQAVVPECVTREKDAVDADGNPQYQGIDTSFLVATLTAAIQEQQALITQLQADVAALKGQA